MAKQGEAEWKVCFLLVGLLGLWAVGGVRTSKPSPALATNTKVVSSPRAKVVNSPWDGSVRQVKNHLGQVLRDPDSVEYINWSEVVEIGKSENRIYMVRVKYRAKNGFGGFNLKNQIFHLDKDGAVTGQQDF